MRILEFFRPFRIVASRRVSEEEQVSVEAFCKSPSEAQARLETILTTFREHRKRSNAEVVAATRAQLAALDTAITARTDEAHTLDEKIAKAHAELRRLEDIAKGKSAKLGLVHGPGAEAPRGNGFSQV